MKENKIMMTIDDLYERCNADREFPVYASIGDKDFPVSAQYYIEGGITFLYMSANPVFDRGIEGADICDNIEREAEDDCWNITGYKGRNTYGDSEIKFVYGTSLDDEIYDIDEICFEDSSIKLVCSGNLPEREYPLVLTMTEEDIQKLEYKLGRIISNKEDCYQALIDLINA